LHQGKSGVCCVFFIKTKTYQPAPNIGKMQSELARYTNVEDDIVLSNIRETKKLKV
jgi:hypothetical protein